MYYSPNIIRMIKSKRMRWKEHVVCIRRILWQIPGNLGRCHSTDSWLPMSYPRRRIHTVIQLHATARWNIVSAATAMHCDWIEAFHQ
jgi:hypothetical protein